MFTAEGLPSVGVFADCTDRSMPVVDLAQELDARGFTGLFLNEHPHLPVANERSSYPPESDIPIAMPVLGPYVALSFVAALTSLQVGPTVSLVAEPTTIAHWPRRSPRSTSCRAGGAVGVGIGDREESRLMACPPRAGQVVEETVEVTKRLWCVPPNE